MRFLRFIYIILYILSCDSKKIINKIRPSFTKVVPKSENQKTYVDYLVNEDIQLIVGLGPAGCGKTMFACHAAVDSLVKGIYDKIIVTRPLVSADEELGFLPGSLSQKMDPWVRPIFDILSEYYTSSQIKDMMTDGTIEISPLAYMRGRTFKRSFIIADEMQNSTPNQMLMMMTRIGDGSKLAVTGDLMQSDLKNGVINGLEDFIRKYKNQDIRDGPIRYIEMRTEDVQRSEVVSRILDIYSKSVDIPLKNVILPENPGKLLMNEVNMVESVSNSKRRKSKNKFIIENDENTKEPETVVHPLANYNHTLLNYTLNPIEDAESNRSNPFISDREAGALNENGCNSGNDDAALIPRKDMFTCLKNYNGA